MADPRTVAEQMSVAEQQRWDRELHDAVQAIVALPVEWRRAAVSMLGDFFCIHCGEAVRGAECHCENDE